MRKMTYTQAATCGENLKVRVTPEQSEKMQLAWFEAGKTWANKRPPENTSINTDSFDFMYFGKVMYYGISEECFVEDEYEEIELIDDLPQHEQEYTIDELINMRGVYFWVDFEQSDEFLKKWVAAGNSTKIRGSWNCYFIITKGGSLCWESESLKENITERLVKIKPVAQKSELQHDFASQQEVTLWVAQGNKVQFITSEVVGFKDGVLWNFSKNQKSDYCFCEPSHWQKHTPPRLIRVNGVEVPAPLESLKSGERFWLIDLNSKELALELSILDTTNDDRELWLKHGLLYTTKEDAIKRAEAMLKFEVVE